MHERNIVTDLALEARELLQERAVREQAPQGDIDDGIEVQTEGGEDIKVTRVKVLSAIGEQKIGKPMGNYITIEVPGIKYNDRDLYEDTCRVLAREISNILKLQPDSTILVVGLGNWNVTPDALGPKVVSRLMVTRHVFQYVPDEVDEGSRPVCAIAPGVLGTTGIETGEIIKGIIDRIKPDVLIAIDSLASRKMDRVNTTIQIADTGIAPGSGVGNKRMELTSQTLGIPVIAIGVPTVVDAATMANDTIDLVLDELIKQAGDGSEYYNMLKNMDSGEKYQLIKKVLDPYTGNIIVTPKEIDEVIDRISKAITNALNISLHENIGLKDIDRFIN
jgi:spore protease